MNFSPLRSTWHFQRGRTKGIASSQKKTKRKEKHCIWLQDYHIGRLASYISPPKIIPWDRNETKKKY
jgi:hypothetical protein